MYWRTSMRMVRPAAMAALYGLVVAVACAANTPRQLDAREAAFQVGGTVPSPCAGDDVWSCPGVVCSYESECLGTGNFGCTGRVQCNTDQVCAQILGSLCR
jgi:hypothetical protein